MEARYLVTAVGGDIGSSAARCLKEEFSKEKLAGCDITPYAPGRDEVGGFFLVPPYREGEGYARALLKECGKRGVTHILPMTEGEIMVLDRHREMFARAGLKVMINSRDILETASSKYKTAAALAGMGLDSPKTWRPGEDGVEIQYPIIVKPDRGCGSRDLRVCRCRRDYEQAVSQVPDPVAQEYIGSPEEEYTAGVFSDGKDVRSIAFKRTLGFGGMSRTVELVEEDAISQAARRVSAAFRLKGALNIQMRRQGGRFYIFEINPRISSTVGFRYRLGFKDLKWWLDLLDGKTEGAAYIPEAPPVTGVRTFGEKIFRGEPLAGGPGGIRLGGGIK